MTLWADCDSFLTKILQAYLRPIHVYSINICIQELLFICVFFYINTYLPFCVWRQGCTVCGWATKASAFVLRLGLYAKTGMPE
jgi:hypothetical protein